MIDLPPAETLQPQDDDRAPIRAIAMLAALSGAVMGGLVVAVCLGAWR